MNSTIKRVLALLLALVLVLSLAACAKDTGKTPDNSGDNQQTEGDKQNQGDETPDENNNAEPTTLVVGYSQFSQKFSPFFAKTAYDQDAQAMTQLGLIGSDREGNMILNGIEGETHAYNGKDYFYDGIADLEIVENEDGTVDYNFTMRDDIVFSDGEPMTIDDVIFSMYVLSDPSYDGSSTFYAVPIVGMQDYRTGVNSDIYTKYQELGKAIFAAGQDNTDFSKWTEEQQTAFWTTYVEEGGAKFCQEIVDKCVSDYASYLAGCYNSEVALGMFAWGFGDVDDAGVLTTRSGATFDLKNGTFPTTADYWKEIVAAYGLDFDALNAESAGTAAEDFVIEAFISGEGPKDAESGGAITSISGIKKTGDYSCTVTTEYFEATSVYQLSVTVAPLHYYGDASLYDYDNNSFGFPKGDLSLIRAKTTEPMGAGPYKFDSYKNGIITFEANENYWKGEPKTKYILFQETADSDKLSGVVSGSFDITDPSFSQDTVDSIIGYNSNGEITGDVITTSTVDNLGYGYIGICANTVKVGDEKDSDASKDLRKAFATLFAVYRDTVINSYYGDRAAVIQYPISNTSWAAPRPNDEGYQLAYSVDVDGNQIYTDSMTEEEKYTAALDAAVGFLKGAGFTWDEASGKFTAAPDGASMTYEVIIPAGGAGDHPSYGILTAAKEALASIGITLEINDPTDSNILWTALESGQGEMWAAAWGATIDPDMYQIYHSSNLVGLPGSTESNHYGITDPDLDELIMEARQSSDQSFRKATYKQCLDIIMDWAVEVPVYQRQNAVIFSTERVNLDTVTPDITTFWTWMNDLEKIEVNP